MSDDLLQEKTPAPYAFGSRKRRGGPSAAVWVVIAIVALGAGYLGARWWMQRQAVPQVVAVAPPPAASAPVTAPSGPPPTADPARVRSLLETVSPNDLFRGWLGQSELVRRWAVITENLAEGVVPRVPLAALAPAKPFSVVERGRRTLIDPDSYRRYDAVADAVASVDAQALARVYRELRPVVEAAYRALGYPEGSLDRATTRALRRIESAPAVEGDIALEVQGGVYGFADPRLESLTPVDKQLLRMGPRNTRTLQSKAREIALAIGLADVAGPGSGAPAR